MTTIPINIGILTVSDSCSRGDRRDESGDALANLIEDKEAALLPKMWKVRTIRDCVPDERLLITQRLLDWCENEKVDLIFSTGGTGLAPTDVTPAATLKVVSKRATGIEHLLMAKSLEKTQFAALSCLVAGVRESTQTLIVNFPGSRKAATECFAFVAPLLPHAIDLMREELAAVKNVHSKIQHNGPSSSSASTTSCVTLPAIPDRHRKSPYDMISVDCAQAIVLDHCGRIEKETIVVGFQDALGRVLAKDVFALDPLPPFRASIKDGYAVVSGDGAGLRPVAPNLVASVAGESDSSLELKPGQCLRINTGAAVPEGADAVIQVEDTQLVQASDDGKEEVLIRILKAPAKGQDIRAVGSDIAKGALVLEKNAVLGPADLGLLATIGSLNVEVIKPPVVSLLSTGNELIDPLENQQQPLPNGMIRDANKSFLRALLAERNCNIFDCGIATDDPDSLVTKLHSGFSNGDILVTTGGVSMGDRDIIRLVLEQSFGAKVHFARVNMKPGKPTTFATLEYNGKAKLFLGLPGNPVSAMVTAHLYLLPICRILLGREENASFPTTIKVRTTKNIQVKDKRPEYLRVVLSWNKGDDVADAEPVTGSQISSRLLSCSAANGLLLLPGMSDKIQEVKSGTMLNALLIGELNSN